jgi:hypothetical protein
MSYMEFILKIDGSVDGMGRMGRRTAIKRHVLVLDRWAEKAGHCLHCTDQCLLYTKTVA